MSSKTARLCAILFFSTFALISCSEPDNNDADTTPPTIVLVGDNFVTITPGGSYVETGATAIDDIDGNLSVTITGFVNTLTAGTYIITYTVTDAASNTSTITRTVNVLPDTTPPTITMNGNSFINIAQGGNYVEAGATATDNVDGNISVATTGFVDTQTIGTYTLTYIATDAASNTSTVTRTIIVPDVTAPAITVNGDSTITVAQRSRYVEAGATAVDDIDGNVSVTTSSSIDTTIAGTYTITYTATDAANNTSTATRTIIVPDSTAPIITLNGDSTITVAQRNNYVDAGATALDDVDGNLNVTTSGSVDTRIAGTYTIDYTATDATSNTGTATRTVIVPDSTAPVITLNGDSTITVTQGDSYVETGATALDDVDTNVSVTITGSVDTRVVGLYTVTYTATDTANNTGTATRTVIIPDATAPVITLNGDSTITVIQGNNYVEANASAIDDVDSDVSVTTTGSVNTSIIGTYTITYTATDAASNTSSATRTINVVPDTTPPVINLNGNNTITVIQGNSYIEAGATATDDVDNNLSIVTTGAVNTSTIGTYTITYTVSDAASNTSTATRTVTVIPDTTPPVITLNGTSSVTVTQGTSYLEAGGTAVDDVDDNLNVAIMGFVDTSILGNYTITYTATDAASNTSTTTRTVTIVLDTIPPGITLTGDNPFNVSLGGNYIEAGATATDNVDGNVSVTISGSVDTSILGTYLVTYSVTDAAGNPSSTNRTVNVTPDSTPPVITLNGVDPSTVKQGIAYVETGATAIDDVDGSVSVDITGSVDTGTLGTYTITYTARDIENNSSTVTRTVNVVINPFVTTWKTDNSGATEDNQIQIDTEGDGYNYTVDWGDGSIDSNVTGDITHTYSSAGTYTVSIHGDFPWFLFNKFAFNSDAPKLLSIEQWGYTQWQSMHSAFRGCVNLVSNASDTPDLSRVTDMSYMFSNASIFNQDLSNWDVSSVTNMSRMFDRANTFNQDLSSWNVSSVTDMSWMFSYASAFNQELNNWDVSSVTDMSYMFANATAFNQELDEWIVSSVTNMQAMFATASAFDKYLGDWNVSSVTNMASMFYNTSAFNQNLSDWNVSSVTNMASMFSRNNIFNQDISRWVVSSVTNMTYMFNRASAFNQDLNDWNVSSVTNMSNMFDGASTFNQNLSDWNVSLVTDMSYMFYNASAFNQDISRWVVSSVTDMSWMFRNASAFNQDLSIWVVSSVTDMPNMFNNASTFNQDISNWDVSSVTDMSSMFNNARAFNQDLSRWIVSSVTNMTSIFQNAINFNQDLSNWEVSSVTSMRAMFSNASNFNQDLNGWNVSSVTNMQWMFSNARAFNRDLGSWTVSSVTDMAWMFSNASAFNKDLNSWVVSSVTDMSYMFSNASTFNGDIGSWVTSSASNMSAMFQNARAFDQDLSSWNVSSVTNMSWMFQGARVFDQDLSNWNVSSVTNMSAMFQNASAFKQDLSDWVVSSVTNMTYMFSAATTFDGDLSDWIVSSVTNMSYMFSNANLFDQDLSGWDVSSVTSMSRMFYFANTFNQDLSEWDVSSVTDMSSMFYNTSLLSQTNYDTLLLKWSLQNLQSDVSFAAGNTQYSSSSQSARDILTGTFNWTVTDGGVAP